MVSNFKTLNCSRGKIGNPYPKDGKLIFGLWIVLPLISVKGRSLYSLREAKISHKEVSNIIFYEKPFLKFERLLETYLAFAPKGFKSFALAMPLWVKDKLFQKSVLNNELKNTI